MNERKRVVESAKRVLKRFAEETDGRWVTMNGRKVFIREGESGEDALNRSLKGKEVGESAPSGSEFSAGETAVTIGGWATSHSRKGGEGIFYGKMRPTRGQSYYFFKVSGKERKFKEHNSKGSPEDQLKLAVEKLGAKFTRPPYESTARPKIGV